jgi:hypothetical protein
MKDITEEIETLVSMRCNAALEECEKYIENEYKGNVADDELRIMAEKLIYKKAVNDTINTLRYFQIIK